MRIETRKESLQQRSREKMRIYEQKSRDKEGESQQQRTKEKMGIYEQNKYKQEKKKPRSEDKRNRNSLIKYRPEEKN